MELCVIIIERYFETDTQKARLTVIQIWHKFHFLGFILVFDAQFYGFLMSSILFQVSFFFLTFKKVWPICNIFPNIHQQQNFHELFLSLFIPLLHHH